MLKFAGTSVIVQLEPNLMGLVEGLCGNYDLSASNDLVTPQGSLETSVSTFVSSWKLLACNEPLDNDVLPCEVRISTLFLYAKIIVKRCKIIILMSAVPGMALISDSVTFVVWRL